MFRRSRHDSGSSGVSNPEGLDLKVETPGFKDPPQVFCQMIIPVSFGTKRTFSRWFDPSSCGRAVALDGKARLLGDTNDEIEDLTHCVAHGANRDERRERGVVQFVA